METRTNPANSPASKPKRKKKTAAAYRHIEHGFEPVFNAQSRILILGSFPSVASRENNFYYGNPQNRFWRVAAACLNEPEPASIDEKRSMLLRHGIALWDVIESCDIKGSSDASIKNVVPARIERIMGQAPIGAVICNGTTSARLYKKYLQYQTGIDAVALPSTSPANAAWSEDRLREAWGAELTRLLKQPAAEPTWANDGIASAESHLNRTSAETGTTSAATRTSNRKVGNRKGAPAASSFATHRSMQGNKRANTKPELLMRQRLREAGLTGYRLQWKVPGRPDIAWPGKKVALFVNGCFWHRCPHCKLALPKKNIEYWVVKFDRNVERDARNLEALHREGWTTHVVWECQLKKKTIDATLAELIPQLKQELGK